MNLLRGDKMKRKFCQTTVFLLIFGVTLINILVTPYLHSRLKEEEKLYGSLNRQRIILSTKKKQETNPVISSKIDEVKMAKEVKIRIDYFYL